MRADVSIPANVPTVVRQKCRDCRRSFHPAEIGPDGSCGNCWNERIARFNEFNPREASTGERIRCFGCGHEFGKLEAGYMSWDSSARSFIVLCVPCAERKWSTDPQYRGTAFGRRIAKIE